MLRFLMNQNPLPIRLSNGSGPFRIAAEESGAGVGPRPFHGEAVAAVVAGRG